MAAVHGFAGSEIRTAVLQWKALPRRGAGWLYRRMQAVYAQWLWQRETGRAPRRAASAMVTDAPLLVCVPHQDDETFGCGGLIALKRERSVPVMVVFLTDGRRCYGDNPTDPEGLVALRRREAVAALEHLGVDEAAVTFLDLPDGDLNRLAPAQSDAVIERLSEIIRAFEPGEVCVPHRRDRHPDHEAACTLAKRALDRAGSAARLWECLIWYFWKVPLFRLPQYGDLQNAFLLSLEGEPQAKKQRAVAEYRSQMPVLPDPFLRAHACPWEMFVCTSTGIAPEPEGKRK